MSCKIDSLDARYSTPVATSSGRPIRPIGTLEISLSLNSASSRRKAVIGVSIGPGWTELHRMLSLAYCMAMALVRIRTEPLEAWYAGWLVSAPIQRIGELLR